MAEMPLASTVQTNPRILNRATIWAILWSYLGGFLHFILVLLANKLPSSSKGPSLSPRAPNDDLAIFPWLTKLHSLDILYSIFDCKRHFPTLRG
ncbi:hypothetical protein CLU79DRAFT_751328 [Phycomyces nitens]|nr:hypothetical protein CLU79DRAFT_751328 [Phycomyces nitens]